MSVTNLRRNAQTSLGASFVEGNTLRDDINDELITILNRFIARKHLSQRQEEGTPLGVVYAEPNYFTKRLSAQQGLFVVPTAVHETFQANLNAAFGLGAAHQLPLETVRIRELVRRTQKDWERPALQIHPDSIDIAKIVIPGHHKQVLLQMLLSMNITAETLFPGLLGLARSIKQHTRV